MRKFPMLSHSPQRIPADMTLPDVPVTIDSGVIGCPRIIEVNCAHIVSADFAIQCLHRRVQAIFFSNVVTGGEGVGRVDAHTERDLRTRFHDLAEVLKPVTDAFTLSGGVLEQDAKRTEIQTS